jgi:phytanoyl-CoA hydroxylase
MAVMPLYGSIRRRYERDGYAVVPSLFTQRECEDIRREIDRIALLPDADIVRVRDLSNQQRAGVSRKQAGSQYYIIGEPPTYGAIMAAIVHDRRLASIASAVLGRRGRSVAVQYHFSNVTNKPARIGPRLGWHRDFPNKFMTTHRAQFCRIMLCLDGMTRQNGPTAFAPGTHLISDQHARRNKRRKHRRLPRRERLAVCPPGSVVVFHPKVRHGGGANRSAQHRRNLIVQWGVKHAALARS